MDTPRLVLRLWRETDLAPFAALNADPKVCEFLPAPLDRPASDNLAARIQAHFDRHGFGLWAVERKDSSEFIGFTGFAVPTFTAPFTSCVEIGWRLAFAHWGQGFATEAAHTVLNYGFESLHLSEIVSFTTKHNYRSRRVMEKLTMSYNPKDGFLHPDLAPNHPLAAHVLYRKNNPLPHYKK